MSGGFFRGTTADQDTRFSNKQAKLLKSQKFAPELEHMVDVSKVKMDVIKPWIAKRVTEFLGGFEDEVLINFIYGLLEGKEINGKAIQIQLTGFMEKNTGKFMKELWGLLISAQKNASGVPQQFLDAKEEETKKKKAETDRITSEIQKRKDREAEEEKTRKTDGVRDNSSSEESNRRRGRGFDSHSGDENGVDVQNGSKGRNRSPRLPHPSNRSPSPRRGRRSMSPSKSFSNSRSYSKERSISKSISPRPRKYSISPVNARRTPPKSASPRKQIARESISPRRRPYSRRSPSPMRRRFHSPLRRRSPSPYRRRRSPPRRRRSPSPWRRRSPSPRRRRSPSPVRQRRRRSTSSPRSRSPVQRRSPYAGGRRYPTPRRRSPYTVRRVSPSPDRRVSQSPRRRRSPSPRRHRSPSPVRRRSPYVVRRSPVRVRRRSPTRSLSRSVSPANRRSVSPARDSSASPTNMKSPGERTRLNDHVEPASMARRQSMAMSPQRDHSGISRSRRKVPSVSPSPPPEKSPSYEDSPKQKTRSSGDNTRLASSFGSSQKTKSAEDKMIRDGSRSPPPEMKGRKVRRSSPHNNSEELKNSRKGEQIEHKSTERGYDRSYGAKKQEAHDKPASLRDIADVGQKNSKMTGLEVPPEEAHALKRSPHKDFVSRAKGVTSYPADATKLDGKLSSVSKYSGDDRPDVLVNTRKKQRSPSVSSDSESEGSEKHKAEVAEKRKHKRHSRREAVSDDTSSESEIEDRKEAKRRKKEEKKSRKEERRRRRDERRRRKEEKRASRRKRKSRDADDLSLDMKENEKVDKPSNGERVAVKCSSDEETESQKKKLEIELREKALESLRAKRGIRH